VKTTEQIYGEMRDEYARLTGLTLNDGGDMAVRFWAAAAQLYSLWVQEEFVKRQALPQTAEGAYLDLHAELRGIGRLSATAAEGSLRFGMDSAGPMSVTIPEGARCTTDTGVEFVTTAAGIIPAGALSCDVPARAVSPGQRGNVPANSIVNMVLPPIGVTACVNLLPFTGGSDGESDASLRARILSSYKLMPNGANKAYYETQVRNIEGVAAASVIPKARGIGTVDVIIAGERGVPDSALIQTVTDVLNSTREICVSILVLPPRIGSVNLTVSVKPEDGWDFSAVSEAVTARITAYFSGALLGKGLLRAALGELIFHTPGVTNYSITAPATDLLAERDMLPVLGKLRISEMG